MIFLVNLVHKVIQLFILVVFIQALLSFVMDPNHPIRQFFDRLVNPFLAPLRHWHPPVGGLDFSPMALIVILYILDWILTRLLLLL